MSFLKKAIGLVTGVVGAAIGFVVGGPVGAAVGFSIGTGIGSVAQTMAMKTKVPEVSSATDGRLNISIDPEANRKIAFGQTALGTDQVYWETFGPENSYFDQVIAAAGHEIESFGDLYFDDEKVTFSGDSATGDYAGALTKQDRTVGVTGTALTVGAGTKWTSAASLTGVAHYALKFQWSQEKFPRGIPNRVTRVGKGALVYDPRLDSTQPGGSGSHRADDQSTWEYATLDSNGQPIGRNPALQVLWYEIGWRVQNPDTGEWIVVCGRGRPLDDIDFAAFITAANDCEDEGYYSDVLLSTGDAHETNIAVLEAACAGKLMDTGGRIGLKIRTDTTGDIVQAFTDRDVLDTDASTWRPSLPLSDRWNQGVGSFVDPRALYQLVPLPTVRDTTYETEDGFKRPGPSFRFDAVQDPDQAQKLIRLEMNISRYQGVFTAPFNWRAKKVEIWDCVTLTFPRLGFVSKVFRVLEKKTDPMGAIWLLLREDDASVYTPGTVNPVPAPAAGAGYDPRVVTAPDAGDWSIVPSYTEGGGAKIPHLAVSGTAPARNIVAAHIYFRQGTGGDWVSLGRFNTASAVRSERASIALNTSYYARIVYENAYGVLSAPTDIGPYTSPTDYEALTAQIADGIIGQGWGATATEDQASNALIPVGGNLLTDTDFKRGTKFWQAGGFNNTGLGFTAGINLAGPYYNNARNVFYGYPSSGTPAAGTVATLTTQFGVTEALIPVLPGERLYVRFLGAIYRATKLSALLIWFDKDGVNHAIDTEACFTSFSDGNAGLNGVTFGLAEGYATVPAGTAYCSLILRGTFSGESLPSFFAAEPMVARVPSWQVATNVPYVPGRPDPKGDKTEESIPANLSLNLSATLDPVYPLSSTASSISIAATTVSWPHNSLSLPAATISGLSDDTSYAVFYDMDGDIYLAIAASATSYYTSVARYLALGTQRTALSGGGYSPPPPPPSGGGGGSYPGLPSIP